LDIGTALGIVGIVLAVISLGLAWRWRQQSKAELAEVADEMVEDLHHKNKIATRATLRAAGIKPPPPGEETIELDFHGYSSTPEWPARTWRVTQGGWSAHADDLPTMIKMLEFMMWELEAGYPDPETEERADKDTKRVNVKLDPTDPEWMKGIHEHEGS
jgi:hypothetical protein